MNTYHVADRFVSIAPALPEIETSIAGETARMDEVRPKAGAEVSVFRGEGRLGRHRRHIDCRWSDQGYALGVDGVGRFFVSADGGRVAGRDSDTGASGSSDALAEVVLGPAVTLALALQGVWCLHASAVEQAGEAVAFVGESGAGKSTLARELPRLDPTLRRAADDILPVTLEGGAVWALPRFPQLKCPPEHQPGSALPERLPLKAVFVLDGPARSAHPGLEPLEGYAAVLALVRHTVAARLFTESLLGTHFEACARLAQSVDIACLRYPHRPGVLPWVRESVLRRRSKCCL